MAQYYCVTVIMLLLPFTTLFLTGFITSSSLILVYVYTHTQQHIQRAYKHRESPGPPHHDMRCFLLARLPAAAGLTAPPPLSPGPKLARSASSFRGRLAPTRSLLLLLLLESALLLLLMEVRGPAAAPPPLRAADATAEAAAAAAAAAADSSLLPPPPRGARDDRPMGCLPAPAPTPAAPLGPVADGARAPVEPSITPLELLVRPRAPSMGGGGAGGSDAFRPWPLAATPARGAAGAGADCIAAKEEEEEEEKAVVLASVCCEWTAAAAAAAASARALAACAWLLAMGATPWLPHHARLLVAASWASPPDPPSAGPPCSP